MKKRTLMYATVALLGIGLVANNPVGASADTTEPTTTETTTAFSNYTDAMNAGSNWIIQQNAWDSWNALAVSRSPQGLTAQQKSAIFDAIKGDVDAAQKPSAGTLARTIVGSIAIGQDPTNFNGQNLVELLSAKITDKGTGNIYSDGPALYALSSKDYSDASRAAIKKLIPAILNQQKDTGEWDSWGAMDLTGFMLQGLAMNRSYPGVNDAIKRAVNKITADYYNPETGDFTEAASSSYKIPNANSEAMLVAGLSACGIDVGKGLGENGTGTSPITAILRFQQTDGSFYWQMDQKGAVGMATEQVIYALDQYDYFKKGKGSIYSVPVTHHETGNTGTTTPATPTQTPETPTTVTPNPVTVQPTTSTKKVVYALRKVTVYKNSNLSKKMVTYQKQSRTNRPTFQIISKTKNTHHQWVYRVRDLTSHKLGYITASAKVTGNVYYQGNFKQIKVISKKGINVYKTVGLKTRVKHVKKGQLLKIKKTVKQGSTTRFVLSNGNYVTANKTLVQATKS